MSTSDASPGSGGADHPGIPADWFGPQLGKRIIIVRKIEFSSFFFNGLYSQAVSEEGWLNFVKQIQEPTKKKYEL